MEQGAAAVAREARLAVWNRLKEEALQLAAREARIEKDEKEVEAVEAKLNRRRERARRRQEAVQRRREAVQRQVLPAQLVPLIPSSLVVEPRPMPRLRQTARKSTGGKASRK
jgi:predicted Holliday junction resolvase-like endonuclease